MREKEEEEVERGIAGKEGMEVEGATVEGGLMGGLGRGGEEGEKGGGGIAIEEGAEMEEAAMEGEGMVAEVGMEGEGSVEDLIDGIRGGKGWDWRRKKGRRMVGLEEEEKRVRRKGRRDCWLGMGGGKEPPWSERAHGQAWRRMRIREEEGEGKNGLPAKRGKDEESCREGGGAGLEEEKEEVKWVKMKEKDDEEEGEEGEGGRRDVSSKGGGE